MTTLDGLLNYIFDDKKPAFYPEFEDWIRRSRRFKAFAQTYRVKIRAKLKNVRDEGGLKDLSAELETAALLLRDNRFTLEYEKYTASKIRGPDFTVMFKTHTPFNVEVRRISSPELDAENIEMRKGKLMAVLCDKVGQMRPGIVNLLWLISEREISEVTLGDALVTLRQLAEHKTENFFTQRGFESAADFLKHYRQLSGIVLCQAGGSELWSNPLAQHKTPPEIAAAIQRLGSI